MVSYKVVLSKLFTRAASYNTPEDEHTSSYHRPTPPSRARSYPTIPASKSDEPRRPRVLKRRPHSTYVGSSTELRGFFSRSRRNSISTASHPHPAPIAFTRSPVESLSENDLVVVQPAIPFVDFDTEIVPPAVLPTATRDSSDIDLLLSNEPADAKKAIIKRLEGLAMALDMVDSAGTPTPRPDKKPSISFGDMPPHMSTLAFESLSPIENWDDEEDMDRNIFSYNFAFGDELDAGSSSHYSYSHAPSSSSESESSASSYAEDPRLPPTPNPNPCVAQYPLSFRLEPIPQLTLDICKSTPSPVFPREIGDHASLFSVEQVVVSWDATSAQHPP